MYLYVITNELITLIFDGMFEKVLIKSYCIDMSLHEGSGPSVADIESFCFTLAFRGAGTDRSSSASLFDNLLLADLNFVAKAGIVVYLNGVARQSY